MTGAASLCGAAARRGGGWEYRDTTPDPASRPVDNRLRILIRTVTGGWLLKADPVARCEMHGGYGTEIGVVRFGKSARAGPVRHALDDIEAFNDELRC